jgi:hypothetical protein
MAGEGGAATGYFWPGFAMAIGFAEAGPRKLAWWPGTVELGVAGWVIGDGERGEWSRGEGELLAVGDMW